MKRRDFLEKWRLSGLKIKLGFLEGEFRALAEMAQVEDMTSLEEIGA
jgi:hypothetical protein